MHYFVLVIYTENKWLVSEYSTDYFGFGKNCHFEIIGALKNSTKNVH